MSEEAVGKVAILQETLDGALKQLQITQNVTEQLRLTLLALTGGKLHPITVPSSDENGIVTVDINVPVSPCLVRYTPVYVKKSKIATLP